MSRKPQPSPALTLLRLVWQKHSHKIRRSWARTNWAMQSAMHLCLTHSIEFGIDDMRTIANEFNFHYWGDAERCYTLACDSERGRGNKSAVAMLENYMGRKPFIIQHHPHDPSRKRAFVGDQFLWCDKDSVCGERVTVTSMSDGKMVACSYRMDGNDRKIHRRYTITHDDIKAYHARIKAHAAKSNEQTGGAA